MSRAPKADGTALRPSTEGAHDILLMAGERTQAAFPVVGIAPRRTSPGVHRAYHPSIATRHRADRVAATICPRQRDVLSPTPLGPGLTDRSPFAHLTGA